MGQACRVLGVDESTLRRWSDNDSVRTFRTPGGHRRFAETDLQDLLAGRAQEGLRAHELGDLAITRIRRQLHRRPARDASWNTTVDEASRKRLRPLGRRLAALATEYLARRTRRAGLLDDAQGLGQEYGRELAASGLPLAQAVEAFLFFRRTMDEATREASQLYGLSPEETLAAYQQVTTLVDRTLVGLTEVYAEAAPRPRKARAR